MLSTDTQILIVVQALGVAFVAGTNIAALKSQGRELKKVKADLEVHDREIGVVYGDLQLTREVRR